jgi:hypothetical protein
MLCLPIPDTCPRKAPEKNAVYGEVRLPGGDGFVFQKSTNSNHSNVYSGGGTITISTGGDGGEP